MRRFPPRPDAGTRGVRCTRVLLPAGCLAVLLMTSVHAVEAQGSDIVADFMQMDGQHATSITGVAESSPHFQRQRIGVGLEFKRIEGWMAASLRGHLLRAPAPDLDSSLNAALGFEVFPMRVGRLNTAVEIYAGLANLAPAEGETSLLEYGATAGLYYVLSNSFALSFSAGRAWVDTEEARWTYLVRLMAF